MSLGSDAAASAVISMPRSHPLKWFGIERILQAAGTFDGRDPAADQLSQAVAKLIPERGLPTGKGEAYWLPRDRHEARALVSSISTAGGDLIAQASVARVVAAARPTTVLEAAGATVVNVPAGNAEYVVPRWHEVSSGGWVSEGEAVPAANFTVATASATPHLCGARLGVSGA